MHLDTIWHDFRYALRVLMKAPGFTAVAILTLAIGIGANTAIFSVVNAVLLRPLPFRDPDALCLLTERLPELPVVGPSYQNLKDWRDQNQSFAQIASARNQAFTLTGGGEPERIQGQLASANLLPLLGVQPVQGRGFAVDEDRAGGRPVVLLSHSFWQSHFGRHNPLGQSINLDSQPYTIIGVLPAGYQLIQPVDVMVPFEPWAAKLPDDRNWHPGIIAVGRLKPGVTIEKARAEMATIAKRLEQQYPVYNTGTGANVNGLHEQLVQNVRLALMVLLGAVAFVLLIACTNVANLLLARGSSRSREIALRTAIGAGRMRIFRQLLTESIVLAVAGAGAGVAAAAFAIEPLERLAGKSLPNLGPIGLDTRVLFFATGIALFAAVLFGLAPFFQSLQLDVRGALNEGGRGSTSGSRQASIRSFLVTTEIALALILLVGAGLLMRSFQRIQNVPPGFRSNNLLVADIPVSPQAHPRAAERMAFFDRLLDRARALPGVTSVGAAASLPVSGGGPIIHFNIEGRAPKSAHDYISVGYRPVSGAYLQTLEVPLIAGRALAAGDTERSQPVAVVNQAMVRRFFPNESALGKHIQLGALPSKDDPYMEIVGIVGDMKQNLATDSQAEMYVPFRLADSMLPVFSLSIVLRTVQEPRAQTAALIRAVHESDPNQPVVKIRSMDENISGNVGDQKFRSTLLGLFALSALLLAGIGLYGLMAYSVSQRTQEFGVRMALGGKPGQILSLVIGQGVRVAIIGVVVGLCGAFGLSRVLSAFLYGVTATDPLTYSVVAILLLGVAFVSCVIPARRALMTDPLVALRHE